MTPVRLARLSWVSVAFLVLGENAHLIFQYFSGGGDETLEAYYIVTDFSMYAVKAYMGAICFMFIYHFYRSRGLMILWITAPIYYILDTLNTLITGNYDGIIPMLICMFISMIVGTFIFIMERYKLERRDPVEKKDTPYRRNNIGF